MEMSESTDSRPIRWEICAVMMSGSPTWWKVATAETRAKKAPVHGEHLRGHVINERVKFWFAKAGLVGDGRPITSHGLRAGAATDLAAANASAVTIRKAGRWKEGSRIPEEAYVRPAEDMRFDPFADVPVHDPERRNE
jgi:hypothetical protein